MEATAQAGQSVSIKSTQFMNIAHLNTTDVDQSAAPQEGLSKSHANNLRTIITETKQW